MNKGSAPAEYPAAFMAAAARVLRDEGAYVNDPQDAGGATKFGISQRQYPQLDVAALTAAQAVAIYYHDWWQRFDYGALPAETGAKLFNLAVNMGPQEAARCLQRALRACGVVVPEDGDLGPVTRAAAAGVATAALGAALRSEAAAHYRLVAAQSGSDAFLRGWLNRAYE